jgi:hypothetical protein
MRARQVSNLDRISNGNVKGRLRSLLDTNARLRPTPHTARPRGINRRRQPRSTTTTRHIGIIVVDAVRIRRQAPLLLLQVLLLLLLLRHRRANRHLFLLGRHWRSIVLEGSSGSVASGCCAKRAEGIVDGFEAGGLRDQTAGTSRRTGTGR